MIREVLEQADRVVQAAQAMILASEQDLALTAHRCLNTAAIVRRGREKLKELEARTALAAS